MANYLSDLHDDILKNITRLHDKSFNVTKYLHRMNSFSDQRHLESSAAQFFQQDKQMVPEVMDLLKNLYTPLTTGWFSGTDIGTMYISMHYYGPQTGNWLDRVLVLWDITDFITDWMLGRHSSEWNAALGNGQWNDALEWVAVKFPFDLQNVISRLPVRNENGRINNGPNTHIYNEMNRFNQQIETWKGEKIKLLFAKLNDYHLTRPEMGINYGMFLELGIADYTSFKNNYKGAMRFILDLMHQLWIHTCKLPNTPTNVQQLMFSEFRRRRLNGRPYAHFLNSLILETEELIESTDAIFDRLDVIFQTYKHNDFVYMFQTDFSQRRQQQTSCLKF